MDFLKLRLSQINTLLEDDWVLEYTPLNHAQCISMLERATILSRLEVIKCILNVLIGNESELFIWDDKKKTFYIAKGYATAHLNSTSLRNFLQQFALLGTHFRQMAVFTKIEFFRGRTFKAFQNVLENILEEIMHKNVEILDHFLNNKTKKANEFNLSLLALIPFLDSDQNDNIILTIRNLYAIYSDVIKELPVNHERLYCNQTLTAIYKRMFIPHRRIRNIVFTMFDHCLRPMFIYLENMLTQFQSISELSATEFFFSSNFTSDDEMYYSSNSHDELKTFWDNFLHFDNQLYQEMPLFTNQTLKDITEAIKSSFVLRKNEIQITSFSNRYSNRFLKEFHVNLNICLERYAHPDESYDIETQFVEEVYTVEVMEPIKHLVKLPTVKTRHFKSYSLPFRTVCDMHTIIQESLRATFQNISRPIIPEFLNVFRCRHLKLFRYYTDFFLVQYPEHILQYVYFMFPTFTEIIATKSFNMLEKLLEKMHRKISGDFGAVMQFFKPSVYDIESLSHISDFTINLELFNHFYFIPSFENDFKHSSAAPNSKKAQNFYDFWPLTELFNPKITELFNEVFQFLLKIRYIQYQIGIDFFYSKKFRENNLSKQDYLLRFRLLNLLFHFGRQMELSLRELVQTTELQFNTAATFDDYLTVHQTFLEKLAHIRDSTNKNTFFQNIISSSAKFCHSNKNPPKNLKNRRQSIYDVFTHIDNINPDDFLGALRV